MANTASLDGDTESLTIPDLRQKIAVQVGCRTQAHTPLDKSTLNSIYAYLTGEFAYPRRARHRVNHPAYCPRHEVLRGVVIEAGLGEPEDGWSASVAGNPRALRRDELLKLAEHLRDTEDKRTWMQEDSTDG